MRYPILALTVIAGFTIPACDSKSPAPASSQQQSATTDWDSVKAADKPFAAFGIKVLARRVDAWHRGSMPVVELRYQAGKATDGSGNEFDIEASMWKGIVALVGSGKNPVTDHALGRRMYTASPGQITHSWTEDTYGTVPRYIYRIEKIDDGTLRMTVLKKFDDGE